MTNKIIIGSRLEDTWGNQWFVIEKDKTGYILHHWRYNRKEHFTFKELKDWKIISR